MIDRKTDYALRCLVGLAKSRPGVFVPVEKLSRQLRIPKSFLAKIVQPMVRRGILDSTRGKAGGIRIKNSQVNLADIIFLFNPRFSFNRCLQKGSHCFLKSHCPVHKILGELQAALFVKLNKVSIIKLAQERKD